MVNNDKSIIGLLLYYRLKKLIMYFIIALLTYP